MFLPSTQAAGLRTPLPAFGPVFFKGFGKPEKKTQNISAFKIREKSQKSEKKRNCYKTCDKNNFMHVSKDFIFEINQHFQ